MIDFCAVEVFMAMSETKIKFLKLLQKVCGTKWVKKKNRFILLLETNNAFRIFMVLSETNGALLKNISRLIA